MIKKKRKHKKFIPLKEYIVMTDDARVFSRLERGYPVFSDNIDEAKPFTKVSQSDKLHLIHPFKLEIIWL
jgi:hypothetical protein